MWSNQLHTQCSSESASVDPPAATAQQQKTTMCVRLALLILKGAFFYDSFDAIITIVSQAQNKHDMYIYLASIVVTISEKFPCQWESLLIHFTITGETEREREEGGVKAENPHRNHKKREVFVSSRLHRMKKIQHDSAVQSLTEKL